MNTIESQDAHMDNQGDVDWKTEYDALAVAAGNTADDADRYFLAWQSARRRAARLAAKS